MRNKQFLRQNKTTPIRYGDVTSRLLLERERDREFTRLSRLIEIFLTTEGGFMDSFPSETPRFQRVDEDTDNVAIDKGSAGTGEAARS